MTIWIVMDGDYDGDWIVAAYESEGLAHDHVTRTGVGTVQEVSVFSALVDSVASIDPVAAVEERERQAVLARANYAAEQVRQKEQWARTEAITIGDRASLCSCGTHTALKYFLTVNGYCRACGGWTPDAFRARFGDDGLAKAIDLLAYHDRIKMRQLTGLQPNDPR